MSSSAFSSPHFGCAAFANPANILLSPSARAWDTVGKHALHIYAAIGSAIA